MDTSIVQMGFNLMLYGMGMVFVFLTVLVIFTTLMSHLIQRYFPEAIAESLAPIAPATAASIDDKTLAIIQAAVTKHRNAQS